MSEVDFPQAEGEAAALIRAQDWAVTALGPTALWPECLRAAVDLMLLSATQIVLFCGPDFVALYNDAYSPTIGHKHPQALGRPARENWSELWSDLEPLLQQVLRTGRTVSAKDRPFYIERHEEPETVYFDISYSAVRDAAGTVHAVFCIVNETTGEVLAKRALEANEKRYRALFDSIDEGACIIERLPTLPGERRDYRYVAMNPAMRAMFGIPDLTGRSIREFFPDEVEDWYDDYDRVLATGEALRFVRESEPQGMVLEMFVSRLQKEPGQLMAVMQDITARRRAEEQQRLLATELGHRMKNLFAVVQAVASQTLRKVGDQAQVRALEDRLIALSHAHDLLLRKNWTASSVDDIAAAAADALGVTERVLRSGPEIEVGPKAALSMALLLHELGTNAVKYGALSAPGGKVSLVWHIEGTEAAPRLVMRWQETGGPTPLAKPASQGFGSRLIGKGLLGTGGVSLFYEPEGLVADFSALLDDLIAAN